MKKPYLILIILLAAKMASAQNSAPQNNLVAIPPTPESSALFKFTETPVAKYTGIPDISIPVYEIKLKALTLPISLNYHSGGYRVDEQSSDVGLGWALMAGGQVTSTVFGSPDLGGTGYATLGTTGIYSFPYNRPLLPQATDGVNLTYNADYTTLMNLELNPAYDNSYFNPANPPNNFPDTQPDMFYYSMFGQSGKFFYTVDGQTHPVPFSKTAISFANNTYQIVDEKGNRYIFDQYEQTNTSTDKTATASAFVGQNTSTTNFTYYLTKIYTLAGDTVTLTYNTLAHYSYNNAPSYTRYQRLPNQTTGVDNGQSQIATTTDVYYSKQLAEITTNRGHKIDFVYQACQRLDMPGRYALQQINVTQNNQVKSYTLNQEYLNLASYNCNTSVDPNTVKLKLKQVAVTGSGNYNLSYYNEYTNFPSRFDFSTDHWGYYNGAGGSPFPADPANGFFSGADKSSNVTYCSQGILQKIQYPTGGYTTYDYELNQYVDSSPVTSITQGGAAVYYDDVVTSQTVNFTIPPTVNGNSIFIKYNCKNDVASPQFNVTLNGPGASNVTYSGISNGTYITLTPGNYTLTKFQNGEWDDGYFQIFWSQTTTTQSAPTNVNGGGLRVKTIKNFNNDNTGVPVHTRNFTYLLAGTSTSSGNIYNRPSYYYLYAKNDYTISFTDASQLITNTTYYNTQTSQSNLPLSGMQFGNVVYSEVQEYESDNNGQNNGYADDYYSFTPNLTPYSGYPFTPPTNFDWENGTLLKSEVYKRTASGYALQKRVTNTYAENYTPPNPANGVNGEDGDVYTVPTQPNETHAVGLNILVNRSQYTLYGAALTVSYYAAQFTVQAYNLISAWHYLTSSYEEDFEDNTATPKTTLTNYTFGNPVHAQLTQTQQTNSDGKQYFDLTTYPNDYAAGTPFIDDMVSAHNIATPVEQVKYNKLTDNSFNVLGGSIKEYFTGGQGLVNNVYSLETLAPVGIALYKFSNSATGSLPNYSSLQGYQKDSRYVLKATIPAYNAKLTPTEVDIANGIKTGYKWGYTDVQPIAVCKNAAANEFFYEGFEESTLTGVQTTGGHTGHNYLSTGGYIPGFSPPNSRAYVISYWSNNGSGWVYSGPVAYTGQTLSGSIDDVRIYPADAQMTTFTYDPLVGATSTTDAKGMSSYYEYDSLWRLINIRDKDGNITKHVDYHYQN